MGTRRSNQLSEATAAAISRLTALDADPGAAPLEVLGAIRGLSAALEGEHAVLASVRAALDEGASWENIAEAAGLKPAAAKWRWQGSDDDISERAEAGRKRSTRPSSVPSYLPGRSVADAAKSLGVSAQAIYLQVSRGKLESRTVELPDGRRYKRVFLPPDAPAP